MKFLNEMLPVAGRIPDAARPGPVRRPAGAQGAGHGEVVRAEIRKAAARGRPTLTARELPSFGQVTKAEKGLIWA